MTRQLTVEEVLTFLKATPEQAVFDWKSDFVLPSDDEKRGELLKDICAIANAISTSYGFIFFGVDPRRPDPLVGITKSYDDARLQQLVQGKIDPPVDFLYYEVSVGPKIVAIIQVCPTRRRPHIIRVDLGKIRKGQIVVRRGSSTDGVTLDDLMEFFYGASSDYFAKVVQRHQIEVAQQRATTDLLKELRQQENNTIRQMKVITGLPPGSLGGT